MVAATEQFERDFFRALNDCVEPAVRAGWFAPGPLTPMGLVLLETKGWQSGVVRTTPLLATRVGECLVVATARGPRSQWARNMEAEPAVGYWLNGRHCRGRATVIRPGNAGDVASAVTSPAPLAELLRPVAAFGWTLAVIEPLAAE